MRDPDGFWKEQAQSLLQWRRPFEVVSSSNINSGLVSWFLGGELNVSGACILLAHQQCSTQHFITHPHTHTLSVSLYRSISTYLFIYLSFSIYLFIHWFSIVIFPLFLPANGTPENCVDRYAATQGDSTALIWECDDGHSVKVRKMKEKRKKACHSQYSTQMTKSLDSPIGRILIVLNLFCLSVRFSNTFLCPFLVYWVDIIQYTAGGGLPPSQRSQEPWDRQGWRVWVTCLVYDKNFWE